MNCHQARQHWMPYLDGEADAALHSRVKDHLASCPSCSAWFAQQLEFEQGLAQRLASGEAMPDLWERVLGRAVQRARVRGRRAWLRASLVAAALVLLGAGIAIWLTPRGGEASDLAPLAAAWHERILEGTLQADFVSTSDHEVDHYLKTRAPFRVHCPPRTDVHFAVQGAGVTTIKDGQTAAYIVGRVEQAPVSILVLDRDSLQAFPLARAHLGDGKRHRCREGGYQMVSSVIADNVVLVIGAAPVQELEKLLDAYGSYHEG